MNVEIQQLWDSAAEYLCDRSLSGDDVLRFTIATAVTMIYVEDGPDAVADLFDQIYAQLQLQGEGFRRDH